ncbi:MAG: hypothetical protein JXA78_09085, partial [Anaerolineales bacterium]|nr:hypothetical protein [Anaerolineales bacterium]
EGQALFDGLATSGLGQYEVTVTADNYLPYSTTFQSQAGPAGGIQLNQQVYPCSSEVEVRVADIDLESSGLLEDVFLISSSGDEESIDLHEVEPGSGFFVGGLYASASEGADLYDGILHVAHDDIITAIYLDENDGTGEAAVALDEAQVDCQAPAFDGLAGISADGCYARLVWEAASDPHGLIYYDIYRSEIPFELGDRIASTWGLAYPDFACSSGTTLYYTVRARDALDNQDGNSVQHEITIYGVFLPLVAK